MSDEVKAIEERVRAFVAEHFGVPVESVTRETTADDIEAWDSMAHAEIVLGLEDEYGVEFEPAELVSMENVGALADTLAAKRSAG